MYVQGFYIYLLVKLKRYKEAKELLAQLKTDNPNQDLSFLEALVYAIEGKEEEALKTFKSDEGLFSLILHAVLGKKDKTLILEQKLTENDLKLNRSAYLWLKNSSIFDFLRDDPRFQEIMAKHK